MNTETWKPESSYDSWVGTNDKFPLCLAQDPESGVAYGAFYNADWTGYNLGTMDLRTNDFTYNIITATDVMYLVTAITTTGDWMAITADGVLTKLDKTTGAATTIGSTGLTPNKVLQSATVDRATGKMYWAANLSDGTAGLYEVNLTTGEASLVSAFPGGEEFVCLYAPQNKDILKPQTPTNLSAEYIPDNFKANVTFTMPTKSLNEAALEGQLSYTVRIDGNEAATGTAAAGETVTAQIVVPQEGQHQISVTASNEYGESNPVVDTYWLGNDTPSALEGITLTLDRTNGDVTLTWPVPAASVNGGYMNPDEVTYIVTRYPDGKVVSRNSAAREFTESWSEFEYDRYYYGVKPVNGSLVGEEAYSNKEIYGNPISVPYLEDFNEAGRIDLFKVIDEGNDGFGWEQDGPSAITGRTDGRLKASTSYMSDPNKHDWILTPEIQLELNKSYIFTYKICQWAPNIVEKYSIWYGQGEDVSTYTCILPETEMPKLPEGVEATLQTKNHFVTPKTAGAYRFAICYMSEPGKAFAIYVDDIQVTESSVAAPSEPSAFTVTPGEKGELSATLNVTAPVTTISGDDLDKIEKIVVTRDNNEVVATFENVLPGSVCRAIDNKDLTDGTHQYSAVVYNEVGPGMPTTASAFIGVDRPGYLTNVRLIDRFDGTATLTWDEPVEGFNYEYVNAEGMTYNIYSLTENGEVDQLLAEQMSGNEYTVTDLKTEGDQDLINFAVVPYNRIGHGPTTFSRNFVTGTPYETPFLESFPLGLPTHPLWWMESDGQYNWATYVGFGYDSDNGCIYYNAAFDPWAYSELNSGKISIQGLKKPVLAFAYYATPDADATLQAFVEGATQDKKEVFSVNFQDVEKGGWNTAIIPLDEFIQYPYITLAFKASEKTDNTPIIMDYISVYDSYENDLVLSVQAPEKVKVGERLTAYMDVLNKGTLDQEDYNLHFFINGEEVHVQNGGAIDSYAMQTFAFSYKVKPTDGEKITFTVEARPEKEDNPADNTVTNEITISVPDYAAIEDLAAEVTGEGGDVNLTWSAPAPKDNKVVEDFEDYDPFSYDEFGDWKAYNLNYDGYTSTFSNIDFPNMGEPFAFICFNPGYLGIQTGEGGNVQLTPHSGDQFLAAFSALDSTLQPVVNDNYLVSPELSGKAQTVSLWCKAVNADWAPEKFQFMYSDSSDDPEEFKPIGSVKEVGAEWTQFTFELPEGALYFCIHNVSDQKFVFMLDDIEFTARTPEIAGYNVYCDGTRVGELNAAATSTVDYPQEIGQHDYYVTVVYDMGESRLSNLARVTTTAISGVEGVNALIPAAYGVKGAVKVVNPAREAVTVFGADGKVLFNSASTDINVSIPASAGPAIVRIGSRTAKVIVK